MIIKIKNGFSRMSDALLETRSNQILNSMTGNANFASPIPTVMVMVTTVSDYSAALVMSGSGDRVRIATKNKKRDQLILALHKWCHYVMITSENDREIAQSSGFELARPPMPRPPLPMPDTPAIVNGISSGELVITIKPVPGSVNYRYELATLEDMRVNQWTPVYSTKIKQVFSGLTPGMKYFVRVVAIGNKGQLTTSKSVSHMSL